MTAGRPAPDGMMPAGRPPATGERRRRVTVIVPGASYSGAELVLIRYVEAMAAAGWSVEAIAPAGPTHEQLVERRIRVTTIPELMAPPGRRAVSAARLGGRWLQAARIIRRVTASSDVVVVNGLLALPAVRLARASGRSTWLVHDVVTRTDLRTLARLGGRGLRSAVAVSEAAAAFPRSLGLDTAVVANGTTWPVAPAAVAVAEEVDGSTRPIVGINASLTPWKGHLVFLDAMAGLPDVDVVLLGSGFAKDGEHVSAIERRTGRADLAGRVTLTGHVTDPLDHMRRWTVAVSASIEPEAGPLAVLEAMSIGLPVVATDHGGATEALAGIGTLVTPGDASALREAVADLLADPRRRREQGRAGRDRIAAERTLARAATGFVDAIDDLADRSAAS